MNETSIEKIEQPDETRGVNPVPRDQPQPKPTEK